jgi:hypothetical protein
VLLLVSEETLRANLISSLGSFSMRACCFAKHAGRSMLCYRRVGLDWISVLFSLAFKLFIISLSHTFSLSLVLFNFIHFLLAAFSLSSFLCLSLCLLFLLIAFYLLLLHVQLDQILLAPLPSVNNEQTSPRHKGGAMRQMDQMNNPRSANNANNNNVEAAYYNQRQQRGFEAGVDLLLNPSNNNNNNNSYDNPPSISSNMVGSLSANALPYVRGNYGSSNNNPATDERAHNNTIMAQDYKNIVSQLRVESAARAKTENTVKWLADQLARSRQDFSSHASLLVNQHSKDSESISSLRERLRVTETEMLENRAWRANYDRSNNGGGNNGASSALAELQAREEDSRSRREQEDVRASRMANAGNDERNKN